MTATTVSPGRVLLVGGSGRLETPGGGRQTMAARVAAGLVNVTVDGATLDPVDLAVARYGHTATLLPDGSVALIGGITLDCAIESADGCESFGDPQLVDQVEIWNPARDLPAEFVCAEEGPLLRRPQIHCLLAVAIAACTTPPTQLVVHVDTDLEVGPEIDGFDVRVWGPAERLVLERDYELVGPTAVTLPASFGVAPHDGDPDRSVRIAVRASRPNAAAGTLEARARTGYVEQETLRLDLFLARACIGVECREEMTCRAGDCEPERIDPETLPREGEDAAVSDAAVPDAALLDAASADAATPDAGLERRTVTTVFSLRGPEASVQSAKVALDPDGNAAVAAIVAGEVEVDGARTDVDATWGSLVARIDADGTVLWSHLLTPTDPASYVWITGIDADPVGRVVVAGTCRGGLSIEGLGDFPTNSPTDTPALRVVFEADGALAPGSPVLDLWNAGSLEPIDLDVTPQGETVLTGQYNGTIRVDPFGVSLTDPTGAGSSLTVRYDADGAFLQACTLTGGTGVAVKGLADGGLAVAGQFAGSSDHGLESHGFVDASLVRFDAGCSGGPPPFAHSVGGTGLDQLFGLTVDASDRTLAVGRYSELDVAVDDEPPLALERLQDGLVLAFEADGSTAFWREVGGEGIDFLTAIEAGADGELWMVGEGGAFEVDGVSVDNAGATDAIVLGASSEGVVRWARSFGGLGSDAATDLAADPLTGELVLTGWAAGPATLGDAQVPADAPIAVFVLRLLP